MLIGSSGSSGGSSSGIGRDGRAPAKKHRTGPATAGPVVFVKGVLFKKFRIPLWTDGVGRLGGQLTQAEGDPAITHVVVPNGGWTCVPAQLQPAGKRLVQYVREEWVQDSLAAGAFKPAAEYPCSPAAPPTAPTAATAATIGTTTATGTIKLAWKQKQQQQQAANSAAAAAPEEQQAAIAREFRAARQLAEQDKAEALQSEPAALKQSFTLLTLNIWFEAVCGPQRMAKLWELLQETRSDFVLLQARLDRVLARLTGWRPVHIGLVGQHQILKDGAPIKRMAAVTGKKQKQMLPVWISDHLGLFCRFGKEEAVDN